VKTSSFEMKLF